MGELCLTWSATFASDLTEQQFRLENLAEDLKTVKFLSLVISCLVVSFALMDLMFQSVTQLFLALLLTRFLILASTALHRTRRKSFAARLIEQETVSKLEAALAAVNQLGGILPICTACKKIRQEDSTWMILEEYISARSEARFSHGLCPECFPKFR